MTSTPRGGRPALVAPCTGPGAALSGDPGTPSGPAHGGSRERRADRPRRARPGFVFAHARAYLVAHVRAHLVAHARAYPLSRVPGTPETAALTSRADAASFAGTMSTIGFVLHHHHAHHHGPDGSRRRRVHGL
nr:MAG: hypothetical protein DIU52_10135 [bacterium]